MTRRIELNHSRKNAQRIDMSIVSVEFFYAFCLRHIYLAKFVDFFVFANVCLSFYFSNTYT